MRLVVCIQSCEIGFGASNPNFSTRQQNLLNIFFFLMYTVEFCFLLSYNVFYYFVITQSVCPSVVLSVCPILSRQYLLNCSTIFNQTLYGSVWWLNVMQKNWLTVFDVKITTIAYIIKIFLNC